MDQYSIKVQSITSLEVLRAYHNQRFICFAFRSILSRDASQEELNHYLSHIRTSKTPAEILTEIRSSKEAKSTCPVPSSQPEIAFPLIPITNKKEVSEYLEAIQPIAYDKLGDVANQPTVSIIILQYFKSNLTSNCIRSLLHYTELSSTEIIVVDNGSSNEHIDTLVNEFKSSIRIVSIGINRYFGEGNNIGVESSKGEFVVLMNNDIVVTKNWLEKLKLQLTDNVGAVGPCFFYPDGRIQECGAFMRADGESYQQMKGDNPTVLPSIPFECDYISAALLLMRKESFFQVGGFDLCYEPAYYEDVDLCLKLLSYGLKTVCQPIVKIFHNENATSSDSTLNLKLDNIVEINRKKFLDRWRGYLVDRSESTLLACNVIGSKALPIKQIKLRKETDKTLSVLLYSPFSLTPGGGERYLLTIAQELLRNYSVTLTFPFTYSRVRLGQMAKYLNLDLTGLNLMKLDEKCIKKKWDISFVIGNSIAPPFPKLALKSFYICQFPFDRASFNGSKIPFCDDYQYLCYSQFVSNHISNSATNEALISKVLPPSIQLFNTATNKEKIIVSVGRFFTGGHCKNQHLLIEAFRKLTRNSFFKDWKLILVGSTRPESEHRAYYQHCLKLTVGLNIEVDPDASNELLSEIYAKARVYWHGSGLGVDAELYPEQLEHFGITPLEAASAGCQVFVPNAGGPCEVANQAPGNFYTYSDIDTLVKLTLQVCNTQDSSVRQNDEVVNEYVKSFNTSSFGNHLEEIINETTVLRSIPLGAVQSYQSSILHWIGWSYEENGFRWSDGCEARIEFIWAEDQVKNTYIRILCHTFELKRIIIHFNGNKVFDEDIDTKGMELKFDGLSFLSGINRLEFSFPDACIAGNDDTRLIALALRELTFEI